jgi:holin-like protein
MLSGLALILGCQLIGEFMARLLGLPVPGPVLGMLLLLGVFIAGKGVPPGTRVAGEALLAHLPLLFVPAGVGLVVHGALLKADWLAIAGGIAVSTILTLAVAAWVLQRFIRRGSRQ